MRLRYYFCWLLLIGSAMVCGRLAWSQTETPAPAADPLLSLKTLPAIGDAKEALDHCRSYRVKSLPGSHQFGSDFIEAMATDPDPKRKNPEALWALTADLSEEIPAEDQAIYLSESTDGGESWTALAGLDSSYFDADIGEGLRNHLGVSPGGTDFVITTQLGAFQVWPQPGTTKAVVRSLAGPRVPAPVTWLDLPKASGDPVTAGVVAITPDGRKMIVSYGHFEGKPQIFSYHRSRAGSWIEDGPLARVPTEMDIFSMQFDDTRALHPAALYVGTGDQAYRLDLRTKRWNRITGVGDDSAIHGMSTVAGLHLAACWGVYNPVTANAVQRVTEASFLLHRFSDESGPELRAYSIEVDALRPAREVVTSITGVYVSEDRGATWRRLNDLPEGEYHTAHFNPDGTLILSGLPGTFLANPFSNACSPRLQTREP